MTIYWDFFLLSWIGIGFFDKCKSFSLIIKITFLLLYFLISITIVIPKVKQTLNFWDKSHFFKIEYPFYVMLDSIW